MEAVWFVLRRGAMPIAAYDHIAIPTEQPEAMMRFYRLIGFETPDPDTWAHAGASFFSMHLGDMRINVHCAELWKNPGFDLRGPTALPGCADLCFVWKGGVETAVAFLRDAGIEIVAGPVEMVGGRAGGTGRGQSVYFRDPDRNLLELLAYDEDG